MDWVSAGKGSAYVERSADGYYAISRGRRLYCAYFISALWAESEYLGAKASIAAAKDLCEQHASKR